MNKSAHKIRIGTATEDQVNQEFTDAWHRAQKGEITEPEEHLYFLEPDNFLKILSGKRLAFLYTLRSLSIRESITLKPTKSSFRQGWEEAITGETMPVDELWTGIE